MHARFRHQDKRRPSNTEGHAEILLFACRKNKYESDEGRMETELPEERRFTCDSGGSIRGCAEGLSFETDSFFSPLGGYGQSWRICRCFAFGMTKFDLNLRLLLSSEFTPRTKSHLLSCCCSGDAAEEQTERQHAHVVSFANRHLSQLFFSRSSIQIFFSHFTFYSYMLMITCETIAMY